MPDAIDRRLPHLLPLRDLATVLVPTYAAAMAVDEEEAALRLGRALASAPLAAEAYAALAAALREGKGPRTTEDALMDRLSQGVQARRGRVKPVEGSPAVAAVLVRVNLEIGEAPEPMRATLASEKGRAVLEQGWRTLARAVVKDLLK